MRMARVCLRTRGGTACQCRLSVLRGSWGAEEGALQYATATVGVLSMTKRIHAKHKIDRRLGENIWGRPKSPYNKREYGPGEHGQRRRGKLSDYGQQLRAKQKLKGYYGNITEKQFKSIYREAARLRGDTSEKLIGLLERRLDAVVFRAEVVPTVFAAPQF